MKSYIILFFEKLIFRRKKYKYDFSPILVDTEKPVKFPLQNSIIHQGFVNSLNNKYGMRAQFYIADNKGVTCLWKNTIDCFQGFPGIIHGGILLTLADELMAHSLVAHYKKFGVTLSSRVYWKMPARVGDTIKGKSVVMASYKNFYLVNATLTNSQDQVVLLCRAIIFNPTLKQFAKIIGTELPDELHEFLRS